MTPTVAVVGASGRLGSVIVEVVAAMPEVELVAAVGSADPVAQAYAADVIIDVTAPAVSPEIVHGAIAAGRRVLVGTSGWSADRLAGLRTAVREHPGTGAVVIPNFSLGSVLGTAFSAIAARYFDAAEILEAHHAAKVDSPSGTAVRTAELMIAQRADRGPFPTPHGDQRARGQEVGSVQIHSIRLPGVVARQEVVLGGEGERLSIVHDTISSDAYRPGIRAALLAAITTTDAVVIGLGAVLGIDEALGLD